MSKLHFELLNKNQIKVLEILKNYSKYGVLGGGTALMIQLPYRKSYDLDVFLPKTISKKFLYKIKEYFKQIEIIVDTGDEFSFISIPHKVKISFIFYPYSPLYEIIPSSYLKILSWRDIGLDKAYTIGRRGEWRDYVDLYLIIKNGFFLKNIIKKAKKKFGDSFSEKLFLSQLTHIGDLKDFTVDFIKEKYSQKEVQDFLAKEVRQYKKEII